MRIPRIRVVAIALVLGLGLLALLARWDLGRRSTLPAALQSEDPLVHQQAVLIRMDADYSGRIASMRQLRAARLVALPATQPEDEVLSAAARLVQQEGSLAKAAELASWRMAEAARETAAAAGRAGIVLGPRVSPELIKARLHDEQACKRFAARVYELHHLVCVQRVLAHAAGPTAPAPSAGRIRAGAP